MAVTTADGNKNAQLDDGYEYPSVRILSDSYITRVPGSTGVGIDAAIQQRLTATVLRYTYNGTRRVRQLALGCESN